jgi:hypothetical protein
MLVLGSLLKIITISSRNSWFEPTGSMTDYVRFDRL